MYGDLKLTFINHTLQQYFREVEENMCIAAARMKINATGEGVKSIAAQVFETSGNLRFKEYLRFVDMGVGKGHPLGGLTSMKQVLQSTGKSHKVQLKDRTIKPRKFYSKTAYGKLTWLENKLLHGYTEEAIALMKKNMTNEPAAS